MLNVIILDDQISVRTWLKNLIDWKEQGFDVIGDTYSAGEALDIIKNHNVDIVITDLKMPEMDGIDFIEKAKMIDKSIKYVVLSGYDDFDDVKKAFKLGIYDYILKDNIGMESLTNLMSRLRNAIKEENDRINGDERVRQTAKETLINRIIDGELVDDSEFYGNLFKINDIKNTGVIALDVRLSDVEGNNENELRNSIKAIYSFINSTKAKEYKDVVVIDAININFNSVVIIFTIRNGSLKSEAASQANNWFRTCASTVYKQYPNTIISGGASSFKEKMLFSRIIQACNALEACYVLGTGKLVYYDNLKSIEGKQALSFELLGMIKKAKSILNNINALSEEEIIKEADSITIAPNIDMLKHINEIKVYFDKFKLEAECYSEALGIFDKLKRHISRLDSIAKYQNSLQICNKWLQETIIKMHESIYSENEMVAEVEKYIYKNYNLGVSLTDIACKLHVNYSYLSRLFKKTTGKNFNQFLTEVRFEKADEILKKDKSMHIYEVAEAVGYKNPESFSRVYKKLRGKSPTGG